MSGREEEAYDTLIRRSGKSSVRSSMEDVVSTDALEYNTFSVVGPASFCSPDAPRNMPLRSVVFHIFKGNVGAGVFLLPAFYQESGSVLGVLVIILLGFIIVDCTLSLIEVKHKIALMGTSTYPAIVRYLLGSQCELYTNVALAFSQFGFCVMYLQYSASLMGGISGKTEWERSFIVLCVLIVTPMTFLSHRMELLAHGSMIAGACVSVAVVGTAGMAVRTLNDSGVAPTAELFVLTPRILLFISGYLFSLEGIGIVLPIENCLSVKDKSKFGVVVKMTLFGIIALYLCFGVIGYLAYGSELTTSVILALPQGPLKTLLEFLTVVSLILSYPVQYVPAIQLVDSAFCVTMEGQPRRAMLLRVLINSLLAGIAAIFGPEALNLVASFIGAFGGVHLMITIPSLLSLVVDYVLCNENEGPIPIHRFLRCAINQGMRTARGMRRLFYLLLTIIVWCGGLYFAGRDTYHGPATNPANASVTSQAATTSS